MAEGEAGLVNGRMDQRRGLGSGEAQDLGLDPASHGVMTTLPLAQHQPAGTILSILHELSSTHQFQFTEEETPSCSCPKTRSKKAAEPRLQPRADLCPLRPVLKTELKQSCEG